MSTQVTYALVRSPWLILALFITHGAAALALGEIGMAVPARWMILVLLAGHFARAVAKVALRWTASAWVSLAYRGDGRFVVTRRDGAQVATQRVGAAFVHPWLVCIRLEPLAGRRWRRFSVVIPCDACTRESHRALRMLLRVEGSHPATQDA